MRVIGRRNGEPCKESRCRCGLSSLTSLPPPAGSAFSAPVIGSPACLMTRPRPTVQPRPQDVGGILDSYRRRDVHVPGWRPVLNS